MKLSIASVSLSGGLAEKLEAIAAAGFRGVEIFENDLLSFDGTPADVRRRVADLGLEIITFQPFRDFEGMPPESRARCLARAERKFALMNELGCDLLLVCSNVSPQSLGGIDRAAADFHALGDLAARHGVRVGFEALAWGRHIADYRDAWEVVRRAEHPAVGLVLDTFHIFARKTDLNPIANIPRDRIFLVQLADAPLLDMDTLSWSRHFRNFPGQGDLPLIDFMTALQATGFDGLTSLEIFNDQFRAGSARGVAVDGKRSLLFLLDQLRRRTGQANPDIVLLPPRSQCRGTAFIEFAMSENDAPAFEALLRGLGFARAGLHKSKAVTRWSQGGINIVVNTETEGFAHAFHITHGTAVCAIGLQVDDAAATLARAEQLLDRPFRQAVGPGELEIPAVRGLGGSLVYFIDSKSELGRVWDIEFKPTGEERRGCRSHGGRPHLPIHALRGDADLGAVLHVALGADENAGAGCARSRRAGQKPGGAVRGWCAPHSPQCLAIGAHPILALSRRSVRLRRAAHRAGHGRHHGDGGTPGGERRGLAADPRKLL